MKSFNLKAFAFILIQLIVISGLEKSSGQEEKPEKKALKNSIKINLTNPMIFGTDCYVLGYERTIGKHQSFSVNIGRFSLPKLINVNTDAITELDKSSSSKGFHMSGDYRFYLAKENKFNSPHGLYIGPYTTYNTFTRNMSFSAATESFTGDLNADFTFRVAAVGFQLGYQFVFWNRVSLDLMMFGPGIASYKIKANLDTTLDPDQESELFQKINEKLQEKIPGYSLVISPGTFEKTGSTNTTSLGYRYVVTLGFRF
jgi:hypothetical protein